MSKLKRMSDAAKPAQVPSSDDPATELRRLVHEHKALTKRAVAIEAMVSDREARKDIPERGIKKGDAIKSDVPEDARAEALLLSKSFKDRAGKLEPAMKRELKRIPVYKHFLEKVWGCGSIVAAYLVTEVDIRIAAKPSQLRRFAGMAVIDGALERRTRGQKNAYNAELRTRLYQMFAAMWKNGAKGDGTTTKYLKIWTDYKHRMEHSARVVDGRIQKIGAPATSKSVSAKGFAHSTGWHKAADVFLWDLYVVWRALDGLPVWSTYQAEKLGYQHASDKPSWTGGKVITLEEALVLVGDVGPVRASVAAE